MIKMRGTRQSKPEATNPITKIKWNVLQRRFRWNKLKITHMVS